MVSEAEPPVQTEKDLASRRDAGPKYAIAERGFSSALTRARLSSHVFRWLRFAPPPANFRSASGADGVGYAGTKAQLLVWACPASGPGPIEGLSAGLRVDMPKGGNERS